MKNRRMFLKQAALGSTMLGFPALLMSSCKTSLSPLSTSDAASPFMVATPESQGVLSSAIQNFIIEANKCNFDWHSFILLRHGKKVAEAYWSPFEKGGKHTLYSLSKSFTSTGIGMLVDAGKLKVTDQVISFFPDDLPENVSDNLKDMTVHHLLCMNTGHDTDSPFRAETGKTWVQNFLAHPVIHAPGSNFVYNTGATYMLGAILHKITGQTLIQYLGPKLFAPLQITDYDWEVSPQGLNTAGYGLRVSTEAIARFGQLYLQKGNWQGKQLISENWVESATKYQGPSQNNDGDWGQGYGYQFWRCKPGFYRGDGAFGQFCIVMPQYDAVLAITSESWNMGKSMQIAWDNLLPGLKDGVLPENKMANQELNKTIATLTIPTLSSDVSMKNKFEGKNMEFTLESNEFMADKISLAFKDNICTLTTISKKGNISQKYKFGSWVKNGKDYPLLPALSNQINIPSAGNATWLADGKLQLIAKFIEGIHSDKLTIEFSKDGVSIVPLASVQEFENWGPETRKTLKGTLIG